MRLQLVNVAKNTITNVPVEYPESTHGACIFQMSEFSQFNCGQQTWQLHTNSRIRTSQLLTQKLNSLMKKVDIDM